MDNKTLQRILVGIYNDLAKAYNYNYASNKDPYIKQAMGKVHTLLEISKENNK